MEVLEILGRTTMNIGSMERPIEKSLKEVIIKVVYTGISIDLVRLWHGVNAPYSMKTQGEGIVGIVDRGTKKFKADEYVFSFAEVPITNFVIVPEDTCIKIKDTSPANLILPLVNIIGNVDVAFTKWHTNVVQFGNPQQQVDPILEDVIVSSPDDSSNYPDIVDGEEGVFHIARQTGDGRPEYLSKDGTWHSGDVTKNTLMYKTKAGAIKFIKKRYGEKEVLSDAPIKLLVIGENYLSQILKHVLTKRKKTFVNIKKVTANSLAGTVWDIIFDCRMRKVGRFDISSCLSDHGVYESVGYRLDEKFIGEAAVKQFNKLSIDGFSLHSFMKIITKNTLVQALGMPNQYIILNMEE